MKQLTRIVIIVYMCFLSLNGYADAIDNNKITLQKISNQISRVENNIKKQSKKQIDLQRDLETIETTLGELNKQVLHLLQLQKSEQQELVILNHKEKKSQSDLLKQRALLSEQIRSAYLLGNTNEIKILFNQDDPNILNRHLQYYRYLTENRSHLISKIKETLDQLSNTYIAIKQHQKKLELLLKQKQNQLNQTLSAQKIRQDLLAKIKDSVQDKQQELANLISNQNTLQQMINQIESQKIDILHNQSFYSLQGKLNWPVKGNLAAQFGSSIDVADKRLSGVIINAPAGSPVKAISSGKVMFANWLRGFGLLIILNHGNGFMSLYARNQSLNVKIGDIIQQGETIATVGTSGGYLTPGLYFEIRRNGIPINPSQWCRYT